MIIVGIPIAILICFQWLSITTTLASTPLLNENSCTVHDTLLNEIEENLHWAVDARKILLNNDSTQHQKESSSSFHKRSFQSTTHDNDKSRKEEVDVEEDLKEFHLQEGKLDSESHQEVINTAAKIMKKQFQRMDQILITLRQSDEGYLTAYVPALYNALSEPSHPTLTDIPPPDIHDNLAPSIAKHRITEWKNKVKAKWHQFCIWKSDHASAIYTVAKNALLFLGVASIGLAILFAFISLPVLIPLAMVVAGAFWVSTIGMFQVPSINHSLYSKIARHSLKKYVTRHNLVYDKYQHFFMIMKGICEPVPTASQFINTNSTLLWSSLPSSLKSLASDSSMISSSSQLSAIPPPPASFCAKYEGYVEFSKTVYNVHKLSKCMNGDGNPPKLMPPEIWLESYWIRLSWLRQTFSSLNYLRLPLKLLPATVAGLEYMDNHIPRDFEFMQNSTGFNYFHTQGALSYLDSHGQIQSYSESDKSRGPEYEIILKRKIERLSKDLFLDATKRFYELINQISGDPLTVYLYHSPNLLSMVKGLTGKHKGCQKRLMENGLSPTGLMF